MCSTSSGTPGSQKTSRLWRRSDSFSDRVSNLPRVPHTASLRARLWSAFDSEVHAFPVNQSQLKWRKETGHRSQLPPVRCCGRWRGTVTWSPPSSQLSHRGEGSPERGQLTARWPLLTHDCVTNLRTILSSLPPVPCILLRFLTKNQKSKPEVSAKITFCEGLSSAFQTKCRGFFL